MLSNAKNGLLALVLWFVTNQTRAAVVLVVFGLVTILALSVVLMPEMSAIAASATAGGPCHKAYPTFSSTSLQLSLGGNAVSMKQKQEYTKMALNDQGPVMDVSPWPKGKGSPVQTPGGSICSAKTSAGALTT